MSARPPRTLTLLACSIQHAQNKQVAKILKIERFFEYVLVFLKNVFFLEQNGGSCALLGNRDSPTLEMKFSITIVDFVLSL